MPVRDMVERRKAAVYAYLESYAKNMESEMKEQAPWTDRTSHARQGLHTGVDVNGNEFTLYASHGEEYGKWLELSNGGNYAIVNPTMDAHHQKIFREVNDLIRG